MSCPQQICKQQGGQELCSGLDLKSWNCFAMQLPFAFQYMLKKDIKSPKLLEIWLYIVSFSVENWGNLGKLQNASLRNKAAGH